MGGGLVSDQPSDDARGGAEHPAPRFAYETFYQLFPFYLAIGMSADDYWNGDADLVKYYRQAAKIKQDLANQQAWLHGMYIYEAVGDLAPIFRTSARKGTRPRPYPKEPYNFDTAGLTGKAERKKREEQSDKKAKAIMEMFMLANNAKFEKKGEVTDA